MAWVAREHQERFVFRLQILDPPGISSSKAAASRGQCQHLQRETGGAGLCSPGVKAKAGRPID